MTHFFKQLAAAMVITPILFSSFAFPEAQAGPSIIRVNQNQMVAGGLAAGSYQYLWFAGQANTPITISLGKSGDLWYRCKILDTSGKNVLAQADVETYEREITFTPPKTANYYLLLTGYYSYGKFELSLKNLFANNQQDNSSETLLQSGQSHSENMAVGVVRRYAFYGKENEPLRITLSPEYGVWARFKILASTGGNVLSQADVESHEREIIFTPTRSEQFHITVSGYYGTGKFEVRIEQIKNLI